MKLYDEIKIVTDKYKNKRIYKGSIGTIIEPEIRENHFLICFVDPQTIGKNAEWIEKHMFETKHDIIEPILIDDMEVIKSSNIKDSQILADLPKQNPKWWCKVENGYILNLLGEKKNKIPYDYNS